MSSSNLQLSDETSTTEFKSHEPVQNQVINVINPPLILQLLNRPKMNSLIHAIHLPYLHLSHFCRRAAGHHREYQRSIPLQSIRPAIQSVQRNNTDRCRQLLKSTTLAVTLKNCTALATLTIQYYSPRMWHASIVNLFDHQHQSKRISVTATAASFRFIGQQHGRRTRQSYTFYGAWNRY